MDWNKNSVGWNTGFQPGVGLDCRSVPGACKDNPDDMAFIHNALEGLHHGQPAPPAPREAPIVD